jgi:hypothetical protein
MSLAFANTIIGLKVTKKLEQEKKDFLTRKALETTKQKRDRRDKTHMP